MWLIMKKKRKKDEVDISEWGFFVQKKGDELVNVGGYYKSY